MCVACWVLATIFAVMLPGAVWFAPWPMNLMLFASFASILLIMYWPAKKEPWE